MYKRQIHGQHDNQTLLHRKNHLTLLDLYGKEQTDPLKEKMASCYQEWKAVCKKVEQSSLDEESRRRELSLAEFEVNEIEEAALIPGEDETLEDRYRKLSNARRIMETAQMVHGMTGYEQGAADMTGNALKEFSRIVDYDKELAPLQEALGEIDSLLSDFCRDLSSYMDSLTFDEETFFETEKRLDLINSLKAKYGQTIPEILSYQKEQQEKLEKLQKFEEGDLVHITINPSIQKGQPHPRFHGKTGKITDKKGKAYIVSLTDGNKAKELIIRPDHLKLQTSQ